MEIMLRYTGIECDNCHTVKPVSSVCPVCGAAPSREDPEVVRRRQIIRAAYTELKSRAQSGSPVTLVEAVRLLTSASEELIAAIENVGFSEGDATDRLLNSIRKLKHAECSIQATPRYRPWLETWHTIDIIVERLLSMVEAYIEAIGAPSPDVAKRFSERGQQALDESAAAFKDLSYRLDQFLMLNETGTPKEEEGVELAAWIEAACTRIGAYDLIDLENRGRTVFKRISDKDDCPLGLGSGLALTEWQVEWIMDPKRFWEMARVVYRTLLNRPEHLRELLADPAWPEDFRSAARESFEAGLEAAAIFRSPVSERMLVRAAINLGGVVVERIAKPLLAMFLAVACRRKYQKLRNYDVGQLVKEARDVSFGGLLFGLDLALRDAHAHGRYEYCPDRNGVSFTSRRREYDWLACDQLLDRVLGALESVQVLYTGLTCAAATAGYDVATLDSLLVSGLSPQVLVKIVLSMSGWTQVNIDVGQDRITVSGHTPRSLLPREMIRNVCSLMPYLPEDCKWLTVVNQHANGRQVASGPTEPWRRWARLNVDMEKEAAFVEAVGSWRVCGRPVLNWRVVRKWAAVRVLELLSKSKQESARRVNLLLIRNVAEQLGDEELARTVDGVGSPSRIPGAPRGGEYRRAIRRLTSWAKQDIRQPL